MINASGNKVFKMFSLKVCSRIFLQLVLFFGAGDLFSHKFSLGEGRLQKLANSKSKVSEPDAVSCEFPVSTLLNFYKNSSVCGLPSSFTKDQAISYASAVKRVEGLNYTSLFNDYLSLINYDHKKPVLSIAYGELFFSHGQRLLFALKKSLEQRSRKSKLSGSELTQVRQFIFVMANLYSFDSEEIVIRNLPVIETELLKCVESLAVVLNRLKTPPYAKYLIETYMHAENEKSTIMEKVLGSEMRAQGMFLALSYFQKEGVSLLESIRYILAHTEEGSLIRKKMISDMLESVIASGCPEEIACKLYEKFEEKNLLIASTSVNPQVSQQAIKNITQNFYKALSPSVIKNISNPGLQLSILTIGTGAIVGSALFCALGLPIILTCKYVKKVFTKKPALKSKKNKKRAAKNHSPEDD